MGNKLIFFAKPSHSINLINAFFRHYKKFGVEDFFCILSNLDHFNESNKTAIESQAKILYAHEEELSLDRKVQLTNYYKRNISDNENEWVFVVNLNEFLDANSDLIYNILRSDANYLNAIQIDRFSSKGLEDYKDGNPFFQFDVETTFTRDVLGDCIFKVPFSRAYVPLEINNHSVSNFIQNYTTGRVLIPYNNVNEPLVRLANFKWHSNVFEEMYVDLTKNKNAKLWSEKKSKFILDYHKNKKPINELIENCRVDQ